MGFSTKCLKCLIVICNLLFTIIGFVVLAGGIFLIAGSQTYINDYFRDFASKVQVKNSTENNGSTPSPSAHNDVDLGEFIRPFGIAVIVFGAVIAIIGLAGVVGVCSSNRVLLIIYATVVILLIIAEIIISILFFVKTFDQEIHKEALRTLTEYYVDLDDLGSYSLVWNYVMIKYSCCGLDGYDDFKAAKNWPRNRTVSPNGIYYNSTLIAPHACCKRQDNKIVGEDEECVLNPTDNTSNWKEGCWKKISENMEPYRTMAIGIVCAVVVAETMLALVAIVIAWTLHRMSKDF